MKGAARTMLGAAPPTSPHGCGADRAGKSSCRGELGDACASAFLVGPNLFLPLLTTGLAFRDGQSCGQRDASLPRVLAQRMQHARDGDEIAGIGRSPAEVRDD